MCDFVESFLSRICVFRFVLRNGHCRVSIKLFGGELWRAAMYGRTGLSVAVQRQANKGTAYVLRQRNRFRFVGATGAVYARPMPAPHRPT